MKKLSERLSDAYMVNDRAEIDKLIEETQEKTAKVQKNTRITPVLVNGIMNDENSSAVRIYDFLNGSFGDSWWEWEFETIEKLLWGRYGVALEEINRDKLWAIKHLCNSQRPFLDWSEFNQTALSFGGVMANFEDLKRPTPGMLINAVKSMQYIRPEEKFSFEVKKYICILLKAEGIYTPPPSIIDIIKEEFMEEVSKPSINNWPPVLKRMASYIENKDEIGETAVDIQAKRLIKAENAAIAYGS
jgi:hypothetical protein